MTNPFSKLSARSLRILYTLMAVVALGVCLINFSLQMFVHLTGNDQCRWISKGESRLLITDVKPGGVTEQAGIKNGDILIKIDGQRFTQDVTAQAMINAKVGLYVTYTIERNGVQFDTHVLILNLMNLGFLAQFLFGLGFLLVGYVVVMAKPQGSIQQMFARFSILSMLFFGLSALNQNPQTDPRWRVMLLVGSFLVASFFGQPLFIRFFLFFPVKRKGHKSITLSVVLYLLSLLLILIIWKVDRGINLWLFITAVFIRYGFFFTGFGIFIHSYFKYVPHERRTQLRPVLIGVAICLLIIAYVVVVQTIDPLAPFLNPPVIFPIMLLVVVPMFFGYAIFRHRLMDVDIVVRRSLIYGTVTASLAAIYLVTVYGIGTLVNYLFGKQENQLLIIVSLVVVAFVFDPIKQKFQNWIDRIFFHERYDYQRALLEFTQELPRLMEMDLILSSILSRLSSTMHIEKLSVFICGDKEGCKTAAYNLTTADCLFTDGNNTLMALLQKTRKPVDLHLLDDEYDGTDLREEEKQKLLRAGVVLSVPMFLQDRLVGFINVGQKMSGKVYSQEDINLLSTVAGQAAIAIENSRLHKSEIEQGALKKSWI